MSLKQPPPKKRSTPFNAASVHRRGEGKGRPNGVAVLASGTPHSGSWDDKTRRAEDERIAKLRADFAARGGKITRCEPRAADGTVTPPVAADAPKLPEE